MDIATLFEKVSVLLDDKKYNSNKDNSDQFYSDDDKIGALNMAVTEFNFETAYNTFSNNNTNFQITTVEGQNVYDLPKNISKIHSIYDGRFRLKESSYNNLEYADDFTGAKITTYYLDYQPGKILFYPIPGDDRILKLRGVFKNSVFSLNDLNMELPFPEDYHEFFKYGVAYHLLQIVNIDSNDKLAAQSYRNQYYQWLRIVKLELQRLSGNVLIYDNNPYNAWTYKG